MTERDERRAYLLKLSDLLCSDRCEDLRGLTADGYGNQLRIELEASERDRKALAEALEKVDTLTEELREFDMGPDY